MNTGILTNPSPSNGYDAVLAALAPHAAPREGSLGGTTPTVHNRVKQTFINPVATYPFIARRWAEGWEQSFHPGDLMFIYTGRYHDAIESNNTVRAVETARQSILANLPVLNTIIRRGVSEGEGGSMSMFRHLDDWVFIGIMRNSSAASGHHPSNMNNRGGNAIAPQRIINIDVRGSTRMFNYWEGARVGGHLWLCWRELLMANPYDPNPMTGKRRRDLAIGDNVRYLLNGAWSDGRVRSINVEDGTVTVEARVSAGTRNTIRTVKRDDLRDGERKSCWQLLPYSEGWTRTADRGLTSMNYQPVRVWNNTQLVQSRAYRRPICVGWVFQGLGPGEVSDEAVSIRKATQICEDRFRLPMIHTFLHV